MIHGKVLRKKPVL